MIEIFKFNYNGFLYRFSLKNNKLIYSKEKDNKVYYSFNECEYNIFNQILKKLIPTNKTVNLSKVYYNDKFFYHKYDIINDYHLFSNIDNTQINLNEIQYLNYKYNQEEFEFAKDKDTNNKNNKIKRIIKIRNYTATIILIVELNALGLVLLSNISPKFEDHLIQTIDTISIDKYDSIDENAIKACINSNSNLNDKEKEFFLSFDEFFDKDNNYFDADNLYHNLSTFKINYNKEKNKNNAGTWNFINGIINIYDATNFNDADKSTLRHEFFHMFTNNHLRSSLGKYFYETTNSLINNEFAHKNPNDGNYDFGYGMLHNYVRFIFELINDQNKNISNQYHANPRITLIVDELVKIIPDEDKAYNLIYLIDEFYDSYQDYVKKYYSDIDYKKEMDKYYNIKENLETLLKKYYSKKYDVPLEDNLYMQYLLDKYVIIDYLINNNIILLPKNYFGEIEKYKTYFLDNNDNDITLRFNLSKNKTEKVFFTIPKTNIGLYNTFLLSKINDNVEYFNKGNLSNYKALFSQLFPDDVINEYIYTSDINVLINELSKYDTNKGRIIGFLNTYEKYYEYLNNENLKLNQINALESEINSNLLYYFNLIKYENNKNNFLLAYTTDKGSTFNKLKNSINLENNYKIKKINQIQVYENNDNIKLEIDAVYNDDSICLIDYYLKNSDFDYFLDGVYSYELSKVTNNKYIENEDIKNISYLIMELFDKNTLKNRYFNQYTNYLVSSLTEDENTLVKANNLFNLYNKYTKYILKEELNESEKNILKNIKKELYSLIQEFYETKYNSKIEDNYYDYLLFDKENAIDKLITDGIINDSIDNIKDIEIIYKSYIKNDEASILVTYNNDQTETINLNDYNVKKVSLIKN